MSAAVLLLAVAGPAFAQGSQAPRGAVSTSIVAGVDFASLTVPVLALPVPDVEVTVGRRTGFTGGVIVGIQAAPPVSFDTGALFSQRGMTMTASSALFGSGEAGLRISYLDLPAHARVRVLRARRHVLSVFAGPTFGLKLDARMRVEAAGMSSDMDFTEELPAVDVGLASGARLDVGRTLLLVSYLYGLTDTTKGDAPEAVTHRVWSIMAGWKF